MSVEEDRPAGVGPRPVASRRRDIGSPGETREPSSGPWVLRAVLVLPLLLLTAWTGLEFRRASEVRAGTLLLAQELGFEQSRPYVVERLRRETDPIQGRLRLARAILAQELDPRVRTDTEEGRAASAQRLVLARSIGEEAAREVRSTWEAPMITGATTYLLWSKARDPRLFRDSEAWEDPLLKSLQMAPNHPEPNRFLATAYLELWPTLAPAKRQEAVAVVARALALRRDVGFFLGAWLERAESRSLAFSALPNDPQIWFMTRDHYARKLEWNAFLAAHERWREATYTLAEEQLKEAQVRAGQGGVRVARNLYFGTAARLPPEGRSDPLLNQALVQAPAGPATRMYAESLQPHLDRAVDLFLLGDCPLEPEALKRLSLMVKPPAPARAALLELAAGSLARGEEIERTAAQLGAPEWSPYLVAKSRLLLAAGYREEAENALRWVDPSFRRSLPYASARLALGSVDRDARAALVTAAQVTRGPEAWTLLSSRTAAARLRPAESASGFEMVMGPTPYPTTPIEVHLDGQRLGARLVRRGQTIRFDHPLTAEENHRLVVITLWGAVVLPVSLRLLAG